MDKLLENFEKLRIEISKKSKVSKTRGRKLLSQIMKQCKECRKILLAEQKEIPVKRKAKKEEVLEEPVVVVKKKPKKGKV